MNRERAGGIVQFGDAVWCKPVSEAVSSNDRGTVWVRDDSIVKF